MNQTGGYINNSHINRLIRHLSINYNQTPEQKIAINNSITNSGHGSILLGTSKNYEGGDTTIRMLIGAHFGNSLKIGIFGGRCERGEQTLDTVIRETIEEIFNFTVTPNIIQAIHTFLDNNPHLYYIIMTSKEHTAYSYIFDVSILGDFIRIINENRRSGVYYYIPRQEENGQNADRDISEYYNAKTAFTDYSSFNGRGPLVRDYSNTIYLSDFLKNRYISNHRREGKGKGLNEIKYLSFATLEKLVAAVNNSSYDIYNFVCNKRENLQMQDFFKKILKLSIITEILKFNKKAVPEEDIPDDESSSWGCNIS